MTRREKQRRMKLAEARWALRKPMRSYTITNSSRQRVVRRKQPNPLLEALAYVVLFLGALLFLYI